MNADQSNTPLSIDILADFNYEYDANQLSNEERKNLSLPLCYFPIGEILYRYQLLEKTKKLDSFLNGRDDRKAMAHGYWVLDQEKALYSLLRYKSEEEANVYTLEDIKNLNNDLRKETINCKCPEERARSLPQLYMLLVKTGEFTVEFSQLVLSILYKVNPSEEVDVNGKVLGGILDETSVLELIKLYISADISEKLIKLNSTRNKIIHFEMKSLNHLTEIEAAIDEAKELMPLVLFCL